MGIIRFPIGKDARRRTAALLPVAAAVMAVATLAMATADQAPAYVSGDLVFTKLIGTDATPATGYAMAAGPDGVVAVAGWRQTSTGAQVPMVAKYTGAGQRAWSRAYLDSPGWVDAVAFDGKGALYAVASIDREADGDLALLKYGSTGTLRWVRTFEGAAGLEDWGYDIAVDRTGKVVVLGGTRVAPGLGGTVVMKFAPDGAPLWPSPALWEPDPADADAGWINGVTLALDPDGNAYVGGMKESRVGGKWTYRAAVARFAAGDGTRLWDTLYEGRSNPSSRVESLAVRGGSVVAVGATYGAERMDGLMFKLGLGGGERARKEWGALNATDEWLGDVVIDSKGNVYVTGDQLSEGPNAYTRAVTMKLTPSLATIVWRRTYLPLTNVAGGRYLVRDGLGNVYVAGTRHDSAGYDDFLLIKYDAAGTRRWVRRWSGGGPEDDVPAGVVLGTAGRVFVSGEGRTSTSSSRCVLLEYQR